MSISLTVVDAFTDQPFGGNPAAVAVLDAFPAAGRMQLIAREMNLSETSFLVRREDGSYDLRWFTPSVEVDLCGHATLAAAHMLGGTAVFHTRSGQLSAWLAADEWIELDFPADPPHPIDAPGTDLGLPDAKWWGRGRFDVVVELPDAARVRSLSPDLAKMAAVDSRAVVVTAPGDRPGIDCVSRVFGPNVGIPEDPVTGSAHCLLAVLWGERTGRDDLVGEQASPRGGVVRMRRAGDRVVIGGRAVTVSQVQLLV